MKFKLLLFIVGQKMKKAAKNNNAFRNFIKGKNVRIVMKTADGRQGKTFIIQDGRVHTSAMDSAPADAAFVWCDGGTAFSVMSSGDDEAIIAALTEKKLQSEGNYKEFIWFLTALGKMSAQEG
ncbi:MAG: hypothetical protein KA369_11085 [Spirochaetes bacterium]|jgi:predicted heme/steroid binding protein|nr:hypothetical protein [Spirochaetota bacterium]